MVFAFCFKKFRFAMGRKKYFPLPPRSAERLIWFEKTETIHAEEKTRPVLPPSLIADSQK
jgi:hypothetical protein